MSEYASQSHRAFSLGIGRTALSLNEHGVYDLGDGHSISLRSCEVDGGPEQLVGRTILAVDHQQHPWGERLIIGTDDGVRVVSRKARKGHASWSKSAPGMSGSEFMAMLKETGAQVIIMPTK